MNFNRNTIFFSIPKNFLLLSLLWLSTLSLTAQDNGKDLSISLGASFGYAPTLNYGEREDAGNLISVFGELQYQNIMGRLQFSSALIESFDNKNLEGGSAIHGSIGYNVGITNDLRLPLLLTGGAAFINYNNGFNGSSGNSFSDVSPQIGVTVAPYYEITDLVSIQAALRYLKGFTSGDEGEAIDLADIAIGIRLSF